MGIIGALLGYFLNVYLLLLFARALISWIPNLDPYHPAVQFLHSVTEPVLEPIRKLVPPLGGMIDISITIAILAVWILSRFVSSAF